MWGSRLSGPPTFTSGCFYCTRLIVTDDQTNVLNCSLLLNTAVCRRLVMITSGEDECQCLDDQSRVGNLAACSRCPCKPTIAHALRGKNELNLSYPLVHPNFQNVVAPMILFQLQPSKSLKKTLCNAFVSSRQAFTRTLSVPQASRPHLEEVNLLPGATAPGNSPGNSLLNLKTFSDITAHLELVEGQWSNRSDCVGL